MKKILSLFLFLFFGSIALAQTVISGKVTNTDGAVASASVTIEDPANPGILAYAISDKNGNYKLSVESALQKFKIKVKAYDHKTETQEINNTSQTLNFKLDIQATEIKEVKIKTKLITKRGDTISYDLKAFETKSDRVLADVLKKIPGIQVNSDGSILYQGEPINKFYVNGKDLMEGSYGTINNSLPKDAVQKVEVMENHQPVKILQDKVPTESAAINVKLKSTVTMTGRGETGVGLQPFLWNLKLTPMLFTPKYQWVLNYKTNNNGESVESENNILSFGNRWEGTRRNVSQKDWLNVEFASTPNLPEKRYLMNNVHYFSVNVLTSPFKNKEWELKTNASYANNAVERNSYFKTVYSPSAIFPAGAVISRDIFNNLYTNQAKGEIIFTKNAKKGFFKNITTFNGFWNTDRAVVDRKNGNVSSLANQSTISPSSSFQNSLSTIIPYKEKLINFMSYISHQKDHQKLYTNPAAYSLSPAFQFAGFNFDDFRQDLALTSTDINHSASVGFTYKKWTFTPEVGLDLNFNKLNSQLFGIDNNQEISTGNTFKNDLEWNEMKSFSRLGINYKTTSFNLSFSLPLNFYGIAYKDLPRNLSKDLNRTVFEPNFFSSLDFASFWKWWTFASVNYNFGDFGSLYGGYIMLNPTSFNVKNSPLPENLNKNIGSRIEYRNPLNNLFFNVRYGFNTSKNNLISNRYITPDNNNVIEIIEFDNTNTNQNQAAEIGKYFPKFKTNASVTFSNRDSNFFYRLNNQLIETKNKGQNLTFKLNNSKFSWLSFDYNITFGWNKNRNVQDNTIVKTSNWNHTLATYFYPAESHTIGFFWDDISSKNAQNSFRNSFYDLSYQYTWTKKKIDFELKWLNIGNNKAFELISQNAELNSVTTSSIMLRPSQFMFTVKFNFK